MTLVGLDDTDSRDLGMCTTYVASRIADRLRGRGSVGSRRLVRLNPAVEHKTRGNAALAIETDVAPEDALAVARAEMADLAVTGDDATNPGLVVAPHGPDTEAVPEPVAEFARRAVRDLLSVDEAARLIETAGYRSWHRGNGRGRIGALAAIGSTRAVDGWTVERIAYRESDRVGTPRTLDRESVFAAATEGAPDVWDTVDREADEVVCVPRTPGPVLYGIRGDDATAVDAVADAIASEPVASSERFLTNQGTDAHLRPGTIGELHDGRAYRIDGVVTVAPETRRGGHVFVRLADDSRPVAPGNDPKGTAHDGPNAEPSTGATDDGTATVDCVAFEPTKRFRDRVRALVPGDRLTACGEVADGTLKLEKFALRSARTTERVTPTCPDCGRRMESAGRDQGFRCRDCVTTADSRAVRSLDRELEPGWYEVPPRARRHVAKPLVRGGFDAPVHPER